MRKTLLIKNGRIINPFDKTDTVADILVEDGKIKAVGKNLAAAENTVDASGMLVFPGLIDLHVHLRDPGLTYKEDILTGAAAAAAGGVTTVAAMPNTSPVTDTAETVKYIVDKAKNAPVRVLPVCAITKGQSGEALTDFHALHEAGAAAFSDDGKPVATAKLMRGALLAAEEEALPILAHCEDVSLAGKGIINEGAVSKMLGVEGIPAEAEEVGTAREIVLSALTGKPVHICHVSTAKSVRMIRQAKQNGVRVTAETAPHYFSMTQQCLEARDADYRMNPPLRLGEDVEEIIRGLQDGTLDAIATDHAPHSAQEKENFEKAPNGVVGLETSLAAALTFLVHKGLIDYMRLAELMSFAPAKILGLPLGTLNEGADADITVFDPNEEWTVEPEKLRGKAHNTAYKGMKLRGRVKYTVCRGEIVFKDK